MTISRSPSLEEIVRLNNTLKQLAGELSSDLKANAKNDFSDLSERIESTHNRISKTLVPETRQKMEAYLVKHGDATELGKALYPDDISEQEKFASQMNKMIPLMRERATHVRT